MRRLYFPAVFNKKLLISLLPCVWVVIRFAHEYVLLAYKYRLQKGDELEVHLLVADGFNVQEQKPF